MRAEAISTVLLVDDVAASLAFYERELGFERTFVLPWFASMKHTNGATLLDLWQRTHPSVPPQINRAPSGVLLALVVADAAAEAKRMRENGVRIVDELRDEPWGQRHFIAADPSGFLIDVVQRIEPTREFLIENGLA
jgi:catechol 2,3-dioxygenase-like lactoylglutathione lyase family enzyme